MGRTYKAQARLSLRGRPQAQSGKSATNASCDCAVGDCPACLVANFAKAGSRSPHTKFCANPHSGAHESRSTNDGCAREGVIMSIPRRAEKLLPTSRCGSQGFREARVVIAVANDAPRHHSR